MDCDVTDCVPVCVVDLTSSPDPASGSSSVSSLSSQLNRCASQTLSFSEKRSASGTEVCGQAKKARINVEEPPVKAVSEVVRTRPGAQSAPCKAVLECVRNRAPPAPEGTPPQEKQTWLGPPSARPLGVKDTLRTSAIQRNRTASSMRITPGIRGNASSSEGWRATFGEVRTSWWTSESWSPTCLPSQLCQVSSPLG